MIPISLSLDSQKRWLALKWNGFFSLGWRTDYGFMKLLGITLPFHPKQVRPKHFYPLRKRFHLPIRWVYLKGAFSFLKEWRLKEVEGTFSFPDPMVNGILYGWMSAAQTLKTDQKINLTINFLGENRCRGEVFLSLKVLFYHFRKWILPFLREMWGRRSKKGGK